MLFAEDLLLPSLAFPSENARFAIMRRWWLAL